MLNFQIQHTMPTHQRPLVIALEGIIASGKTTLLKQLQTHSNLKIKVIPEPIDAWKNVQKFNVREYLKPPTSIFATDQETTTQLIHNSHNSRNGHINTTNNHLHNITNKTNSNINNHRIFDENKNNFSTTTSSMTTQTTETATTDINPANTNSLISTYINSLPNPPTEEGIKEKLEDPTQFELLSQMYHNPERWSYSFQVKFKHKYIK